MGLRCAGALGEKVSLSNMNSCVYEAKGWTHSRVGSRDRAKRPRGRRAGESHWGQLFQNAGFDLVHKRRNPTWLSLLCLLRPHRFVLCLVQVRSGSENKSLQGFECCQKGGPQSPYQADRTGGEGDRGVCGNLILVHSCQPFLTSREGTDIGPSSCGLSRNGLLVYFYLSRATRACLVVP